MKTRSVNERRFDRAPRITRAREISPLDLDQDAVRVVSRLKRHGHEAYLVGGCVRDLLIGRTPKDFDVATSARPRQIKRIFRNSRIIGRRFKLAHIIFGERIIETSTFRQRPSQDRNGADDELLITSDNEFGTAEEDAYRRDFTINGLFFDPERHEVIDYVGGLEDLDDRSIRTIGDPHIRFKEDPVRIMRAIKFASRLEFRIEDETWDALGDCMDQLRLGAPPRVLEELMRLLRSGHAHEAMRMLHARHGFPIVVPEIARYLEEERADRADGPINVEHFWRSLEALDALVEDGLEPSGALCLATMFHHPIDREIDPDRRRREHPHPDLVSIAEDVFDGFARRTRLSRRDTARTKRLSVSLRRFLKGVGRRQKVISFVRQETFVEALTLLHIHCMAHDEHWDAYYDWVGQYRRLARDGALGHQRHVHVRDGKEPHLRLDAKGEPLDSWRPNWVADAPRDLEDWHTEDTGIVAPAVPAFFEREEPRSLAPPPAADVPLDELPFGYGIDFQPSDEKPRRRSRKKRTRRSS